MKGLAPKRTVLKMVCYRIGNYTAGRRVTAFFSLDSLQTGAVKGLTVTRESFDSRTYDSIIELATAQRKHDTVIVWQS